MKTQFVAFAVAMATTFGAYAMDLKGMPAHHEAGVTCQDCHGDGKTPLPGNQTKDNCLTCHANNKAGTYYYGELDKDGNGKYFPYTEGGKVRQASFHDSHVGEVRCTVCHTAHEMQSTDRLYCNHCHQFELDMQ